MATSKLNDLVNEAIKNIREDRDKAKTLLEDVAESISNKKDSHRDVGIVAAKYLETLQRSNEQLVKITAIMKNKLDGDFGDLDEEDKGNLYDELEDEKDGKKQV